MSDKELLLLGKGVATAYDVLKLTDGMTVAELLADLTELPGRGVICINSTLPEHIDSKNVRFPVIVKPSGKQA